MEKIGLLIERLLEQYQKKSNNEQLRITAQMLLSELEEREIKEQDLHSVVSVFFPAASHYNAHNNNEKLVVVEEAHQPETIVTVEPEKQTQEQGKFNFFDPMVEIPTLALKRQEVNETIAAQQESLNDKLKAAAPKKEVAHNIKDGPVKDLRKAIGINDQYLFINELFRNDQIMYERSIKTINSFNIYGEAEFWIKRELKLKLAWNEESEAVHLFDQLVKRRFS
jgi:phage antirepressor YoqD-like protein